MVRSVKISDDNHAAILAYAEAAGLGFREAHDTILTKGLGGGIPVETKPVETLEDLRKTLTKAQIDHTRAKTRALEMRLPKEPVKAKVGENVRIWEGSEYRAPNRFEKKEEMERKPEQEFVECKTEKCSVSLVSAKLCLEFGHELADAKGNPIREI